MIKRGSSLSQKQDWENARYMPMEISKRSTGLTIMLTVSQQKGTSRFTARKLMRARASSLTSMPHRYPRIPYLGMAKSTNASRMTMANTFWKKVDEVLPRPFKMLPMVVARYIKGHSHDRMVIYVPAF